MNNRFIVILLFISLTVIMVETMPNPLDFVLGSIPPVTLFVYDTFFVREDGRKVE